MTSRAAASTLSALTPGRTCAHAASCASQQHLVVRRELGRRLADAVGAGLVRAVAVGHRAADVDDDRVAGLDHAVGELVVRAGAVRAARHDDEVDTHVALGDDRVGDVLADLALGAAGAQPLRHLGVDPVDRRTGTAQRLDLLRRLAHPQLAQHRAGQQLVDIAASRRAAAAPSRPTCGCRAPRARVRAAASATSAYGSSVSPHACTSRPSSPIGLARAAGFSRPGTTTLGSPSAGTTRQVSRSSGIASYPVR